MQRRQDSDGGAGTVKTSLSHVTTKIRPVFWALAIVLGFLQGWASRLIVSDDTTYYLDMGDYFWRGKWWMAVNGIWSPLYAVILGLVMRIFRPSPYWEYPLVHLILFLIFLLTFWCFDFFLQGLIVLREESETDVEFSIPPWVWLCLGYTLFLWSSLRLIGVSGTDPDMLVAASFFLACGLLVRIRRGTAGWLAYWGLGLTLGVGYLAKSIMFPISLICLAIALVSSIQRHQVPKACGALLMFLCVSAPFIAALSLAKGRVTFGESGRYNYAVHVNHLPPIHWQGEIPGNGRPIHCTRQILDRPATFEFGTPFEVTYAPWFDPSYWYDGLKLRINLSDEVKTIIRLLRLEALFFFELNGSLVAGLFVMFYMSGRKWWILRDIAQNWFVLLPAVAALGLYSLIYLEPRYLAPFITVAVLCLFFSVHLPVSHESQRLCSAITVLILAMFVCPIGMPSTHVRSFVRDMLGQSKPDPNSYAQVASEMYRMGLRPGDRIASLEYSSFATAQWARLARVRIVAEVYYWPDIPETRANDFWTADSATQEKVIHILAKTGASVIVSQEAPTTATTSGWSRAGDTHYYLYWLRPEGPG